MNYLGHAYFSFEDPEVLAGNMIGDYVKGDINKLDYSPAMKVGLKLHRFIDDFTDHHPAIQRAKEYFRAEYRLYSGPIVDCVFDYYIANDPHCFNSEADLNKFTQSVYQTLADQKDKLPIAYLPALQHMTENNWLYNYRTIKGIKKSMIGVANQSAQMPDIELAYQAFVLHFYILNQYYIEFIADAKIAIQKQYELLKHEMNLL